MAHSIDVLSDAVGERGDGVDAPRLQGIDVLVAQDRNEALANKGGVPTILMLIPVLFPAAKALGIDPVHFCIVIIVNIELGLITPPVGLNLFVGSAISRMEVVEVFRAVLPWMCITIVMLFLVTYVPELSLFLPRLIMG